MDWRRRIMNILKISPDFFTQDTVTVAEQLLGMQLVRIINGTIVSGMIVETEAYRSDDPACHGFRGKTERNAALFGNVGHAYVYISYGIHHCFNIVARSPQQEGGGVLIRALEPLEGIEIMQNNRGITHHALLTNGPGKLTQALGITREHNMMNVCTGNTITLQPGIAINADHIIATPRIGITKATDKLWRFYIRNNKYVSQ